MIAFTLRETSQRGQSCIEWQNPGEPPRVMPHSLQVPTEIGVLWAASPMILEALRDLKAAVKAAGALHLIPEAVHYSANVALDATREVKL